jgi:hypothetical protein
MTLISAAGVANNVRATLAATRTKCVASASAVLAASASTAALATNSLATTTIAAPLVTAALAAAVFTAAAATTVISVAVASSAATALWAALAKVFSLRVRLCVPALPALPREPLHGPREDIAWSPPPAGFDWGMAF